MKLCAVEEIYIALQSALCFASLVCVFKDKFAKDTE